MNLSRLITPMFAGLALAAVSSVQAQTTRDDATSVDAYDTTTDTRIRSDMDGDVRVDTGTRLDGSTSLSDRDTAVVLETDDDAVYEQRVARVDRN